MMNIRIKKLLPSATVPTFGSDGAACFDLYAAEYACVNPWLATPVKTGLAFEIPPGFAMLVFSRSGHAVRHKVRLANSVGVIDSDYRGDVTVLLHSDNKEPFYVQKGDRIAQAMVIPVPFVQFKEVEELTETARGEGGFGSTGV